MVARVLAALLVLSILHVPASSAGPPVDEQGDDKNLKEMRVRAELLRLEFADEADGQPLSLVAEPILRYGDPARIDVDGTLWIWERDGQPAAVAAIWLGRPPAAKWTYELTSLTDRPLKMTGRPAWTWKPDEQKRKWVKLEGEVPDESQNRLRVLRSLARKFEATQSFEGQTYALRLLPTPLHRYSSESSGVMDGALFSLAHGTNPEVLVQVEARSGADRPSHWVASIARLSGASLEIKLSGVTQWTEDAVGPFEHVPDAPYFSTWDNDTLSQ